MSIFHFSNTSRFFGSRQLKNSLALLKQHHHLSISWQHSIFSKVKEYLSVGLKIHMQLLVEISVYTFNTFRQFCPIHKIIHITINYTICKTFIFEDASNNCLSDWTSDCVTLVSSGIRKQWDKRLQFIFFKKPYIWKTCSLFVVEGYLTYCIQNSRFTFVGVSNCCRSILLFPSQGNQFAHAYVI